MEFFSIIGFVVVVGLMLIGFLQFSVWTGKFESVDKALKGFWDELCGRNTVPTLLYCYPNPLSHEEAKKLDLSMLGEVVYVGGKLLQQDSIQYLEYRYRQQHQDSLEDLLELLEYRIKGEILNLRNGHPDCPLFLYLYAQKGIFRLYIALSDRGRQCIETEKNNAHARRVASIKPQEDLEE
ncbi:hypothetical protein LJC58_08190 [Lachnospiraceae bacterium OttesenSCG-928-D06]|nr:hypothetical protein [Lachnospiraceae bacterium OttesenSCG-928-D06]